MLPMSVFPLLVFVGLASRPSASQGPVQFTSPYNGQSATGIESSSFNSMWSFSGNFSTIDWGLRSGNDVGTVLVTLYKSAPTVLTTTPPYAGRVSGHWNGQTSPGQASFTLDPITKQDEVYYGCKITPEDDFQQSIVDFVKLVVKVPPKAVVDPQVIAAKKGDSASFTCTATGDPSPNISWYRSKTPGAEIVNSNDYEVITNNSAGISQLAIKNVSVEDPGYFVCDASSAGFDPGSARSFFGVSSLSSPRDSGAFRTAKVYMQELVVVECPVSGFPPPEVTWTLPNGSVLPRRLDNTLSVNPTTDADFGNYTCIAESLDKTIGPFITSIQKRVSSLNFNVASGAPVVVTWDPVSNVSVYAVGVTGNEVEDFVQIGGCSLNAKGRCSMEIHFNTLPPKTKPDPVEIFVEVSALNVHIEIIARGDDRKKATVSAAVTLQASVMHLFVVLVLVLNR